jgi:hypothetical protein
MPAEVSAPPAELLRLRLLGVVGRDAKNPNPPMLLNDSFGGNKPNDFEGGVCGDRSSKAPEVGVVGSLESVILGSSGIVLYSD